MPPINHIRKKRNWVFWVSATHTRRNSPRVRAVHNISHAFFHRFGGRAFPDEYLYEIVKAADLDDGGLLFSWGDLERRTSRISPSYGKAATLVISLVWLVWEILCELLKAIYLCLQQYGVWMPSAYLFFWLRGPARKIDARLLYGRREFLVYINRQNRESHFI